MTNLRFVSILEYLRYAHTDFDQPRHNNNKIIIIIIIIIIAV